MPSKIPEARESLPGWIPLFDFYCKEKSHNQPTLLPSAAFPAPHNIIHHDHRLFQQPFPRLFGFFGNPDSTPKQNHLLPLAFLVWARTTRNKGQASAMPEWATKRQNQHPEGWGQESQSPSPPEQVRAKLQQCLLTCRRRVPRPQWMPRTADSTKPHRCSFPLCIHTCDKVKFTK